MSSAVFRPRASVVICAHDEAATLESALSRIFEERGKEFEVVVVDDASGDATPAILRRFDDPRLVVTRNAARLGIAASRNRAVSLAKGAVILVADGDDELVPGRIRAQLEFLEANPDVALVGGYAEAVDAECHPLGILSSPLDHRTIRAAVARSSPLLHPTLGVRKAALAALGGYREKFPLASDLDLLFRLVERFQAAAMPRVLCRYRLSPKSVSVRDAAVSRACIDAAKRFAVERVHGAWISPVLPGISEAGRDADSGYHLLAGKLAAGAGNMAIARRHFAAAGWAGAPYLGAATLGSGPYASLQRMFGTEG